MDPAGSTLASSLQPQAFSTFIHSSESLRVSGQSTHVPAVGESGLTTNACSYVASGRSLWGGAAREACEVGRCGEGRHGRRVLWGGAAREGLCGRSVCGGAAREACAAGHCGEENSVWTTLIGI